MATRKKRGKGIGGGDLKSRLNLGKSLKKKAEPAPAPVPQAAQNLPFSQQPQSPAPGQPGAPGQHPGAPGQPYYPPGPPAHARRPPAPKKRPKPEWTPPVQDDEAGADVSIDDHNSRGRNVAFVGILGIACVIFVIVGFVAGNGRQERKLYDLQSKDAARVLEVVEPKVKTVQGIAEVFLAQKGGPPNAKVMAKLEQYDYVVEPESIASNKLILGADITTYLLRFAADSRYVAELSRQHVAMTNRVDKKEIESLISKADSMKAQNFGVIFDSGGYVKAVDKKKGKGKAFQPFEGKLVTFDSQDPREKGDDRFITVRYPSSGKELDISLKSLIYINGAQLVTPVGPNALKRYSRRHRVLFEKFQEMDQYMNLLVEKLEELSSRGSAPLLSL